MEHLKMTEQLRQIILVTGKHSYVLDKIASVLTEMGFRAIISVQPEDVLRHLKTTELDGLFLAGGLDPLVKTSFVEYLHTHKPGVKIIYHEGGPANIKSEVNEAFKL